MSFAVRPIGASQVRQIAPADVFSLLHFDGANGSTTFTDAAGNVTWARSGNAQIKTDQSVFGGASGYFDGNGDYLTSSASATLKNLLTQSFTISGWVRPVSGRAAHRLFCTGGGGVVFNATNGIQSIVQIGLSTGELSLQAPNTAKNGAENIYSSNQVSWSAWNHFVAQVDTGRGLWAVGLNGLMTYAALPSFGVPSSTPVATIATLPGEAGNALYALNGYMDDLRVVIGTAQFTTDYYPVPDAPYPDP